MIDPLKYHFATLRSRAELHSSRYAQHNSGYFSVCCNVSEPPHFSQDRGAILCVRLNGVEAYAATNDLFAAGLQAALEQAERQAERIARHALFNVRGLPPAGGCSQCRSSNQDIPFPSPAEYYGLLTRESAKVPRDERLVNWSVFPEVSCQEQLYLNSVGAEQYREQRFVYLGASVTAYDGHDSQTRSPGGHHAGQQDGAEVIEHLGPIGTALRITNQTLQLLAAPDTSNGRYDLLLMPDQMILQIRESIDHSLELDRTLGDEHNYVGTGFIEIEDLGCYQYDSGLLNVSFDPETSEELASYYQGDDGGLARKKYLIREGRLLRPLGGALSQYCNSLEGAVNSRASSWDRASIDRMANLSLELGDKSFARLVGGIEREVLVSYNHSWSIDDARNKFRFGCERGQSTEDGELKDVVKNPNYRGISAQLWCNPSTVSDAGAFEVLGTPYCGEGELNQVIRVGHASPACVLSDVGAFGGGV